MTKTKFTEEQQEILRSNPYTLSVNDDMIRFTVSFKKFVLEEKEKPGMTLRKIFVKANYNPELLGKNRMDAIFRRIRKQAASTTGLRETGKSTKSILKEDFSKQQTRTTIKKLQDHVAFLEQEIEFLKKISLLPQKQ